MSHYIILVIKNIPKFLHEACPEETILIYNTQLYITMFAALITSLTVAAPLQVHIAQGNVRLEQPGSLQAAVVVTLLLSLSEQAMFFCFFLFFFFSRLSTLFTAGSTGIYMRVSSIYFHCCRQSPHLASPAARCSLIAMSASHFTRSLNVRFPLSFFFLYLLQTSPRARSCCSPTSTGPAR